MASLAVLQRRRETCAHGTQTPRARATVAARNTCAQGTPVMSGVTDRDADSALDLPQLLARAL